MVKKTKIVKIAILILFFLAIASVNNAQQLTGTIRGHVVDSTNGEALAFANVYIKV